MDLRWRPFTTKFSIYIYENYIQKGKRVFNYVLGAFGHIPLSRNKEARPDLLQAQLDNESLQDIDDLANQFYYRTKAIYEYIEKIQKYDPNSILLLIGDHTPKVLRDYNIDYKFSIYHSSAILLYKGKRINIHELSHYQVPYRISSLISSQSIPVPGRDLLETCYTNTIAKGMGVIE